MSTQENSEQNINSQEIIHEHTVYAEPIFKVGDFNVTNSLINSWIIVGVIVIFSLLVKLKLNAVPRGVQNLFEFIIESLLNVFDSVTGERSKSEKLFHILDTVSVVNKEDYYVSNTNIRH